MSVSIVERAWKEALKVAIENKKLENPLYWADPNTWGSNGRKEKRGLTALWNEIRRLPKPRQGKWYDYGGEAIRHLRKVEDFATATERSFKFSMSDPECFEESLYCGIAVIVVRVWFCDPKASSELAGVFTPFLAVMKTMLLYLERGRPIERAYEQLEKLFVTVITALDAVQFDVIGLSQTALRALRDVSSEGIYLHSLLSTLHQNPLPNAMARHLQATPVPPQPQWTASNVVPAISRRVESTPVPPQPQWTAHAELLARLERVEAALNLSMSQSNGTPISQSTVQDAMVETRAWVIRSTDAMSMHSGMSRDTEFYVGPVAPPYALDAPLLSGDRYYTTGPAGTAESELDYYPRMEQ